MMSSLGSDTNYSAVEEYITNRKILDEILPQLKDHGIINSTESRMLIQLIENDYSKGWNSSIKFAASRIVSSCRNRITFYEILRSNSNWEWDAIKLYEHLICNKQKQQKKKFSLVSWVTNKGKECDCDLVDPLPQKGNFEREQSYGNAIPIPNASFADEESQVSSTTANTTLSDVDYLSSSFASSFNSFNSSNNSHEDSMHIDNDEDLAVVIYQIPDIKASYLDENAIQQIDQQHVNAIARTVGLPSEKSGLMSTRRMGNKFTTIGKRPLKAKFASKHARDTFYKRAQEKRGVIRYDGDMVNVSLFKNRQRKYSWHNNIKASVGKFLHFDQVTCKNVRNARHQ